MSVNVNCKGERVFVKISGDYVLGSILVSGGKDVKGNYLPNGFMRVKFSYDCQDAIYDHFNGDVPKEIKCDMEGFLTWNEYKDIKEVLLVVTKVSNIEEYSKVKETPFTKTRRGTK